MGSKRRSTNHHWTGEERRPAQRPRRGSVLSHTSNSTIPEADGTLPPTPPPSHSSPDSAAPASCSATAASHKSLRSPTPRRSQSCATPKATRSDGRQDDDQQDPPDAEEVDGDEEIEKGQLWNAGKRWTVEEDHRLRALRASNTPYEQIGREFGKTPLACRLHYHHISNKDRKSSPSFLACPFARPVSYDDVGDPTTSTAYPSITLGAISNARPQFQHGLQQVFRETPCFHGLAQHGQFPQLSASPGSLQIPNVGVDERDEWSTISPCTPHPVLLRDSNGTFGHSAPTFWQDVGDSVDIGKIHARNGYGSTPHDEIASARWAAELDSAVAKQGASCYRQEPNRGVGAYAVRGQPIYSPLTYTEPNCCWDPPNQKLLPAQENYAAVALQQMRSSTATQPSAKAESKHGLESTVAKLPHGTTSIRQPTEKRSHRLPASREAALYRTEMPSSDQIPWEKMANKVNQCNRTRMARESGSQDITEHLSSALDISTPQDIKGSQAQAHSLPMTLPASSCRAENLEIWQGKDAADSKRDSAIDPRLSFWHIMN